MQLFVTATQRLVPESETDQAGLGLGLKVRTVGGALCIAINDPAAPRNRAAAIAWAAQRAANMERRGHVLWDLEDYLRPAEWDAFARERLGRLSPRTVEALRRIMVEGVPIGFATGESDPKRRKNARTTLRRLLKELGWTVE